MLRTFNVGIGMVVMVGREKLEESSSLLSEADERPIIIGEIVEGAGEVHYEGAL